MSLNIKPLMPREHPVQEPGEAELTLKTSSGRLELDKEDQDKQNDAKEFKRRYAVAKNIALKLMNSLS